MFGEVFANESIGMLIEPSIAKVVRTSKEKRFFQFLALDDVMEGELFAVVTGDGSGNDFDGFEQPENGLDHLFGSFAFYFFHQREFRIPVYQGHDTLLMPFADDRVGLPITTRLLVSTITGRTSIPIHPLMCPRLV